MLSVTLRANAPTAELNRSALVVRVAWTCCARVLGASRPASAPEEDVLLLTALAAPEIRRRMIEDAPMLGELLPQLEKAARVLGLNEWSVFFRVTLPMAWRGILAGVLLAFARALGEFGATLMVAGSIPGRTQTLSVAVYEAVQAGQDSVANVLVLITSITCIVVLLSAGRLVPGRVAQ